MRSFSDVNLLIVVLLALAACAVLNLQTTYGIAERVCELGLRLLGRALGFA